MGGAGQGQSGRSHRPPHGLCSHRPLCSYSSSLLRLQPREFRLCCCYSHCSYSYWCQATTTLLGERTSPPPSSLPPPPPACHLQGIDKLIKYIFSRANPKQYAGLLMTGPVLAGLAEAYVKAINAGAVPTIATAWQVGPLSLQPGRWAGQVAWWQCF